MKRPLLYLAGGFVLGEVCGLRCMGAVKSAVVFTAVLPVFLLRGNSPVVKDASPGKRPGDAELLQKRSMGPNPGPVLFAVLLFLTAAVPGFLRGSQERRIWKAEQALAETLDGSVQTAEGRLSGLLEREEQWELTLSEVRFTSDGKAAGTDDIRSVRRLIVYLPKEAFQGEGITLHPDLFYSSGSAATGAGEIPMSGTAGASGQKTGTVRPCLGIELEVQGEIHSFEPASNPGQFDFQDYYRAKKTACRMSGRKLVAAGGRCDRLRDLLWRFSARASEILLSAAGPDDAGVFTAILLGDKSGLSGDIRSLYQRNGIAHLLAVSGLHLSMISLAVYGCLRRLGLGFGLSGIVGGLLLSAYAVMTGFQPSVVRALVMALCGYLASCLGRTYDLKSALALAGILILWDSPYELTQAGVQLSFAAVGSIAFVAPGVQYAWRRAFCADDEQEGLRLRCVDALAFGFALQAGSLPIVLYHFFQMPLYGIFLNIIVIPLMSMVVVSGALGIALGSVNLAAGRFAVGGGRAVLQLYEVLCRGIGSLPYSTLVFGRPKLWQIGIYYGLLVSYLIRCERKRQEEMQEENAADAGLRAKPEEPPVSPGSEAGRTERIVRVAVVLVPAALCLFLLPLPLRGTQTVFLDVGQGDGICIRTQKTVILMDGGSTSDEDVGENILEPYLKSSGISVVDYAFVSHGDADHINGLRYLMAEGQDIRIRHLILPAVGREDPVYGELGGLAEAQGGSVHWFAAGDRLAAGGLELRCLYPAASSGENSGAGQTLYAANEDRNSHSLVLAVRDKNLRLLLTGDMSEEGERELLAAAAADPELSGELEEISILKVAHHGSRYSSCEDFLRKLSPQLAVISCAAENRYGHPAPEAVERLEECGSRIVYTMESGTVTLISDGRGLRLREFRNRSDDGY